MIKSKTEKIDEFELREFFPYLVRVFYSEVTSAISSTYVTKHDLSPAEWRTIAIIGKGSSLTANEIVEQSSMDKVSISRAVTRLNTKGLIDFKTNVEDGRSKLLTLSLKGETIYHEIVRDVLDVEQKLLSNIDDKEKQGFLKTMQKICDNKTQYFPE